MLTFMLHITVKSGCESEALSTLSAIEQSSHQDRGCINFVWLQHQDTPYNFTLFEQWESQEHLDAHLAKSPSRWDTFVPCLDGTPRSEKFRLVTELAKPLNENEISTFVQNWFDKLSQHVAVSEILPMISETNLEMEFPEQTLRNKDEFSKWYEEVGRSYSHQEHILEKLDIQEKSDYVSINLAVIWKAQKNDNSCLAFRAEQAWKIVKSFTTGQPVIMNYRVLSLKELK